MATLLSIHIIMYGDYTFINYFHKLEQATRVHMRMRVYTHTHTKLTKDDILDP